MIVLLPALAVAVAAVVAASLRLRGVVSALLAGYLVLVANIALVTWALSPFHVVTRAGLLVAELVLLAVAVGVWWRRGRPLFPLPSITGLRGLAGDPVTAAFVLVLVAVLVYELVVALTAAPNNWDSLTYHLSRAADWNQHHSIEWIANAPTQRMNEFQPLAEQEILFGFAAAGSGMLYALPQFVAQLAILVAVYGASRRLGFERLASVRGAALLATFGSFALQSTTAQNDLVAASFPIVAACLLLGSLPLETVLAGAALGLGVGAKLTTVLVWPVLAWLALPGGRAAARRLAVGGGIGLLAGGLWSYVLNLVHTGHVLGHGQGRTDQTVSPSVVTDAHTFARLVYRLLDLGLLSDRKIWVFAALGIVAGFVVWVTRRGAGSRPAAVSGIAVAVPLLVPALVLGIAPVVAWFTKLIGIPVHDPIYGFSLNRAAADDSSAFGAMGAYALIAAPIAVLVRRRSDRRLLGLALALPVYLVLLGLYAGYNIWLTRFLVVPAALAAPLFAILLRGRLTAAAVLVVAATTVFYTLAYNNSKPALGRGEIVRPWNLDQATALEESPAEPTGRNAAGALVEYDRIVPTAACVGAVLDPDEWSYPLWGPSLRHRLYFLPSLTAVATAVSENLRYVIVSTGANAPIADLFTAAGWHRRSLNGYWTLVTAPGNVSGCPGPE
ncbi:MAG TPA: hypothetical protein VG265_03990 [Gaiellaceae bacterium]|nr:hypothetical protein [Gaiellaceae bacterium]